MTKTFHNESTAYHYSFNDEAGIKKWMSNNKDVIGVAFVGRSNVGKSTLINALFGKKVSRTSKTPGRTRSINVFSFSMFDSETKTVINNPKFIFFDLPGYGFAQVSKEMSEQWNILMDYFFRNIPNSVLLLNLQDARHPNQNNDQEFNQYIAQINRPTTIVFNKIDKLKTQKERAELLKVSKTMKADYRSLSDFINVSAENGDGVLQLEQTIITYLEKFF